MIICSVLCRGFPVWLKYVPGIEFRTNNQPFKVRKSLWRTMRRIVFRYFIVNPSVFLSTMFKVAMQGFVQKIVNIMKSEKLFEPQGGPIIMSQVG